MTKANGAAGVARIRLSVSH